jgi:aminopeptidase N
MWYYNAEHPLRRFFSGLTEQTFMTSLGMVDPGLVDYLSLLLSRFIHSDALHRLQAAVTGRRLEEVADMLLEAAALPPEGRTSREVHRHIGDFTLFWTGVYPEALRRLRSALRKDHFIDYCEQGKRSYYIASTFEADPYQEEAPVLRRISEQFELCAYGLTQVRKEWEKVKAGYQADAGATGL